jgi:putative membrane protein
VRQKHARRCAQEQFLSQELHTTRGRTGVLIFVALAERYCEIIADTAIAAKIPPEGWRGIIDRLLAEIRAGRAVEGLVGAIAAAGAVLAAHFPPGADNPDELPDHLIVLPVWPP